MRQWRVMDVGSRSPYVISLGLSACSQHPVSPVVPCSLLCTPLPAVLSCHFVCEEPLVVLPANPSKFRPHSSSNSVRGTHRSSFVPPIN